MSRLLNLVNGCARRRCNSATDGRINDDKWSQQIPAKNDLILSLSLHLKRICKDAFRVAGAVQKTCSSEMLGGQGADFLRGVAFWSIRSVGLLRWFCVTGAALRMTWHQFFVAGAILRDMDWKNRKTHWHEVVSSALHSTFHFWRKPRRIQLFLMLPNSKIEEVSQNCFVLDVVKFKKWRSLADLFRFWCCQRRKMRKSRRRAWFSSWQIDRQVDR